MLMLLFLRETGKYKYDIQYSKIDSGGVLGHMDGYATVRYGECTLKFIDVVTLQKSYLKVWRGCYQNDTGEFKKVQ